MQLGFPISLSKTSWSDAVSSNQASQCNHQTNKSRETSRDIKNANTQTTTSPQILRRSTNSERGLVDTDAHTELQRSRTSNITTPTTPRTIPVFTSYRDETSPSVHTRTNDQMPTDHPDDQCITARGRIRTAQYYVGNIGDNATPELIMKYILRRHIHPRSI